MFLHTFTLFHLITCLRFKLKQPSSKVPPPPHSFWVEQLCHECRLKKEYSACTLTALPVPLAIRYSTSVQCKHTSVSHDPRGPRWRDLQGRSHDGFSAIAFEKLFYVTIESQSLIPSAANFCFYEPLFIQFCIKFFIITYYFFYLNSDSAQWNINPVYNKERCIALGFSKLLFSTRSPWAGTINLKQLLNSQLCKIAITKFWVHAFPQRVCCCFLNRTWVSI